MGHAAGEMADRLKLLCLAQTAFHIDTLADVEHAADHANRPASLVPDHKAPIHDAGHLAVLFNEAILTAPEHRLAGNDFGHALGHLRTILGVKTLLPGLTAAIQLLPGIAEYRGDRVVPPDVPGGEIPVPDHVIDCAGNEFEALSGLAKLGLLRFATRYIALDGHVMRALAVGIEQRRNLQFQPVGRAGLLLIAQLASNGGVSIQRGANTRQLFRVGAGTL